MQTMIMNLELNLMTLCNYISPQNHALLLLIDNETKWAFIRNLLFTQIMIAMIDNDNYSLDNYYKLSIYKN